MHPIRRLQCVKLMCEGIFNISSGYNFPSNWMERGGKKGVCKSATAMASYKVFYGSVVMETSSPRVSTVTVGKTHQFIRVCKEPE